MKMTEKLFSYGTLQLDKVQKELFGRLVDGQKDKLRGYKLSTIEIRDESVLETSQQKVHLIAVPSDNNQVIEGTVLSISKEQLQVADDYETDDYKRVTVVLESGKKAWVYIAVNEQ
jgi:gamma-glutamylcyclotransferase (GGCT)/AIG2-like uncharacterized protein YtfP